MNIKDKTFTFHTDAGHGWLKVSQADCNCIGLSHGDFSQYSYQANLKPGLFFYLEEDRDAAIFLEKFNAVYGKMPKMRERYAQYSSKIRSMARLPA